MNNRANSRFQVSGRRRWVPGVAVAVGAAVLASGLGVPKAESQTTTTVTPVADTCGMCVVSPSGTTLSLSGGAATEVKVTGGGVHVRSTGASGAVLTGSSRLTATGQLRFGGGYSLSGPSTGRLTGTVVTNASAGADPYAGRVAVVATPVNTATTDFSGSTSPPVRPDRAYRNVTLGGAGTVALPPDHTYRDVTVNGSIKATLQPGVYRSIVVSGAAIVTLSPGVFTVYGSVALNGSAVMSGTGAGLVLACSSGNSAHSCNSNEVGAGVVVSGASVLTLNGNPGTASVVLDANSRAAVTVNGSSTVSLPVSGIDAPSAGLTLSGTAKITAGNPVVVATATLSGSANINVTVAEAPDPTRDTDNDGVPDERERLYGSDVAKGDTDADGLGDRFEIEFGGPYLLVTSSDSDGDGNPRLAGGRGW